LVKLIKLQKQYAVVKEVFTMGFLDHKGGAEFPYYRQDVFNAILEAVPRIKGMRIDSADIVSGHIIAKAGVSLTSWGENVPISVLEVSPIRTRIEITSTPKTGMLAGGMFDMGKNRKNIEKIIEETSKILSQKQQAVPPPPLESNRQGDISERLRKLNDLLRNNVITKEDYEKRKSEILSQI
jgi:hypothetical protein